MLAGKTIAQDASDVCCAAGQFQLHDGTVFLHRKSGLMARTKKILAALGFHANRTQDLGIYRVSYR